MAGAEVTILRHLATSSKPLVVGADIKVHDSCKDIASGLGLWPGQMYGAVRSLLLKDEIETETCGVGERRLQMTGTGRRRIARVMAAESRRAPESVSATVRISLTRTFASS